MVDEQLIAQLFSDPSAAPDDLVFLSLMDEMPVNVTIADAKSQDMPLVYVNKAFCNTTGYAADEVVGRNCRFLQGPDTDPNQVSTMREALAAGESVDVEVLNYRKTGEPFWNALKLRPVRGQDGTLTAYLGIQQDVTRERGAWRDALQRSKLEAMGRMAGALTHELNNLLQPAVNFVRFAHDEAAKDAPNREKLSFYLEKGLASARAAKSVTKDLEAYARRMDSADSGALQMDLAASVRTSVEAARFLLPDGVRLDAELSPDVFHLEHDPDSVSEVIKELFDNAAWAMGHKGVIQCRSEIIKSPHPMLQIRVWDDGPGIDPISRSKVFDPFFSTKPAGHGSGLGLSVVYNIVQSWGGDISMQDGDGPGACFILHIPSAPAV